MAGVGSVWNTGNWHWEEKNYKQWGQKRITDLVLSLILEENGFTLTFPEVSKLTGEASVNIRKGKTILYFEFEIEGTWKAVKDEITVDGKFKILEFNQEEIDDFQLEATCTVESEESNKLRYFLQTKAKKEFTKQFQIFFSEFRELESNTAKLQIDKQKRSEEEQKRQQALVETSEAQAKILREAQEKEAIIRESAEKARDCEENKGQGSVWNTGSYFWEEKSVSWAADRIKALLDNAKIPIPNGEILITVTEVLGESSVSIRKGKKIITYCHEVKLKFDAKTPDLNAAGEIHIPDISEDSNYELHITFTSNNPGQEIFKGLIENQFKTHLIQSVQIFVNELKEV